MPDQPQSASGYSIALRAVQGLNLTDGMTSLSDGEFFVMDEVVPYSNGCMALCPGSAPMNAEGGSIARIWAVFLNGEESIVVQMEDGSVYIDTMSVAPAGSTTVNGLHVAAWIAPDAAGHPATILWTDTVKGYGTMSKTGTLWSLIDVTLNSQAIAIYAGRVWLAQGGNVLFSAPDNYQDFTLANQGGSFAVTNPCMSGPVVAMASAQGYLYLAGNGMVALNNVTVTQIASGVPAITTYYVQDVSATVNVTNDATMIVVDNSIVLATGTGVWQYYGLNGKLLSAKMGNVFTGSGQLALATVFGRRTLVTDAGYCMMLDSGAWFYTAQAQSASITFANAASSMPPTAYAVSGTSVVSLFSGSAPVTGTVTTRLIDAGNPAITKRLYRVGFEIFNPGIFGANPPNEYLPSTSLTVAGLLSSPAFEVNVGQSIRLEQNVLEPGWRTAMMSLDDRYFSASIAMKAIPGTAIGAILFQFQPSVEWPPSSPLPPTFAPR